MINEYIKYQTEQLGCKKAEYLKMIGEIQIQNFQTGMIIFGCLSVITLMLFIGGIFMSTREKNKNNFFGEVLGPFMGIVGGIFTIIFIAVFLTDICDYFAYKNHYYIAALKYIDSHLTVTY